MREGRKREREREGRGGREREREREGEGEDDHISVIHNKDQNVIISLMAFNYYNSL